jgi:hypothetical protein
MGELIAYKKVCWISLRLMESRMNGHNPGPTED